MRMDAMKHLGLMALLIWLAGCRGKVPDELNVITLDPSRTFQTMEGFGASDAWRCQFVGKYWPEERREYIADLLFSREADSLGNPKGIGLSIWRFYLGSGTMELGDERELHWKLFGFT